MYHHRGVMIKMEILTWIRITNYYLYSSDVRVMVRGTSRKMPKSYINYILISIINIQVSNIQRENIFWLVLSQISVYFQMTFLGLWKDSTLWWALWYRAKPFTSFHGRKKENLFEYRTPMTKRPSPEPYLSNGFPFPTSISVRKMFVTHGHIGDI